QQLPSNLPHQNELTRRADPEDGRRTGGPLFAEPILRCDTSFPHLGRTAAPNLHPGPALSKMGYALKALQRTLETCITSTLRRRRQGVEAADIFICDGGLHYSWLGRNLDFDAAERCTGNGLAGAYAESRQRRDHVQYWRLFVLPCCSQ